MSKVMRFFDPSSPVTNTACIADVSFGSGAASDAPESTHFPCSALKIITCVFEVLPPTRTASPADHGRRMGLIDGGALDPQEKIACGAEAPMVNVSAVGPPEPS
jgi:hypothetical protein